MRINGCALLFKCLAIVVSQPVCSYCLEVSMFFCNIRMNFEETVCYLVLYLKYFIVIVFV